MNKNKTGTIQDGSSSVLVRCERVSLEIGTIPVFEIKSEPFGLREKKKGGDYL
jgi:hypothetical protein